MIRKHRIDTRNNGNLIKLPRVKIEFGKKSFKFQGAKIYNNLPIDLREEKDIAIFKRKIKLFFKNKDV